MWRKTPGSLPTEAPTHSLISFEPHDASIKACRLAKQHGSDDQDRVTAHNLQDAAFSGGTTAALLASPRCSIPIVCSARKMADTAAFSAIVYHVFGQEGPCQHANRVTFRPKPVEIVRFPLQTRVSANPHLINLIHDACFCGSIGHFFCFAQSSWRGCGTVVGSVPWIPFFVSGRPGNTGMRHALPTTPSYGPTLSHDASR